MNRKRAALSAGCSKQAVTSGKERERSKHPRGKMVTALSHNQSLSGGGGFLLAFGSISTWKQDGAIPACFWPAGREGVNKEKERERERLGWGGGERGTPLHRSFSLTRLTALYNARLFFSLLFQIFCCVFLTRVRSYLYRFWNSFFQLPTPTQPVVLEQLRLLYFAVDSIRGTSAQTNSNRLQVSNSLRLHPLKCQFRIHTIYMLADLRAQ